MRRILCWFGWHNPDPGLNLKFCIAYHCNTCGELVPGRFSSRKK